MLRCNLLNVIFAIQDICESFFAFSNIKKKANLRLSLHAQKLSVSQDSYKSSVAKSPDFSSHEMTISLTHRNNNLSPKIMSGMVHYIIT